jgi:hypothetical protein
VCCSRGQLLVKYSDEALCGLIIFDLAWGCRRLPLQMALNSELNSRRALRQTELLAQGMSYAGWYSVPDTLFPAPLSCFGPTRDSDPEPILCRTLRDACKQKWSTEHDRHFNRGTSHLNQMQHFARA